MTGFRSARAGEGQILGTGVRPNSQHNASSSTKPNFRQVGTRPSGAVLRGAAVRHQHADKGSRVCSIPSKYETVLYRDPQERNAFGARTHRFGDNDNELPGPGMYYRQSSLIKTTSESGSVSKLGYSTGFVSKTKRFNDRVKEVLPGPGQYQQLKPDKKPQNKKYGLSSFANTPKHPSNNQLSGSTNVPGPGDYNVNTTSAALAHNIARSAFASTTSRGFQPKHDVPAPGQYDQSVSLRSSGNRSPQSIFKSTAKRLDDSTTCTPGPGAYNAEDAECALRYDWIAKAHTSAVFCKGQVDRFGRAPAKKVAATETELVGPGSYNVPSSISESGGASSAFKSSTSRADGSFGGFAGVTSDAPGPAFYHPTSPSKKSYLLNGNKKWL